MYSCLEQIQDPGLADNEVFNPLQATDASSHAEV